MSLESPTKDQIRNHVILNYIENLTPSLKELFLDDKASLDLFDGIKPTILLGSYNIFTPDFFQYLRAIADGDSPQLYDSKGEGIPISGEVNVDGSAVLTLNEDLFRFDLVTLFSESKERRQILSDTLFQDNTVPVSDEVYWRERINQSSLSIDEFSDIERIIDKSVENILDEIRGKLKRNDFNFDECLPKFEQTFFSILGEPEKELSFSQYYNQVYLPCCDNFLKKGLVHGFKLIGPSCVLPNDLIVKQFLSFESDELYASMKEALATYEDPFTLSLLLDICADRFEADSCYISLGCNILEKLTSDISKNCVNDFSAAVSITLDTLSKSHLLRSKPLYFRRLSAWTWGGMISRVFKEYGFDRAKLLEAINDKVLFEYTYTGALERREDPYWSAEWLLVKNIHGLIRRRIAQSFINLESKEIDIPADWLSIVENADKETNEIVGFPYYLLPGPFDGICNNKFSLLKDASQSAKILEDASGEKSDIDFLAGIRLFVNIFEIEKTLMNKIQECAKRIVNSELHGFDSNTVLLASQTLGYVAGICRDPDLAETAIDIVHALTTLTGGENALFECYLIIYSAGAFSDYDGYNTFVAKGLEQLSRGVISRHHAEICLNIIERISLKSPEIRPYLGRIKSELNITKRHAY